MPNKPGQPHVLVVDRAPAPLALMRELLEEERFYVLTCSHLPASVDVIKQLQPDLVILDTFCPGQDPGRSLLRALRLDQATCDIPIVLCTGAEREAKNHAWFLAELGIAVVFKPFDIDALLETVEHVLHSVAVPRAC